MPSRSVSPPRYLGTPPPAAQAPVSAWWWKGAVAGAAALVALGALVMIQKPEPTGNGTIVVLVNVDGEVAGNGLDAARDRIARTASDLADHGGGTLTVIASSGQEAQTVAQVDLAVDRAVGEPETDDQVRHQKITERVSDTLASAAAVRPAEPGRNVLSLLVAAGQTQPRSRPFTVFYVGFGLGTVDPADARIALAGEPAQAVDAIRSQLPQLPGAQLHVVFPAAAGAQEPLNTITAAWRREYWVQMAAAMDATLVDVTTDLPPAAAAPGAAAAPTITNIPDPTPPPSISRAPTKADPAPVVLGGGSFLPDSDRFVDDEATARALSPLTAAWTAHPGAYAAAECTGRTAAIGPAPTARLLAQQRADHAAEVLRSDGIGAVTARGVGFDDPLPDFSPTDPNQRSVVCRLTPRH